MSLQMHRKTDPLKGSIVGNQAHIAGLEILQQLFGERFSRCKVCTPGLAKTIPFIGRPGNQQDLKGLDLWHNGTGRIFRYPPRCRSQYRSAFLSNISPLFDVKSRRTPWHPPARLLICVSLSEGNPAVPHRHRRPEHPHRPARQNQTLLMPCRTDGHHPDKLHVPQTSSHTAVALALKA